MSEHYPFQKLALPYGYTGLFPMMEPGSVLVHHIELLSGYVDTLNALLARYPQYQDWTLEQLITDRLMVPEVDRQRIQNYAGAVYNHRLFFDRMCPQRIGGLGEYITHAITRQYGSIQQFQEIFTQAAHSIFGSGWVWLNTDSAGNLHIAITRDNHVPALHAFTPLLVLDMWEHAYFLQFPADTDPYIKSWFMVINGPKVDKAFLEATGV